MTVQAKVAAGEYDEATTMSRVMGGDGRKKLIAATKEEREGRKVKKEWDCEDLDIDMRLRGVAVVRCMMINSLPVTPYSNFL